MMMADYPAAIAAAGLPFSCDPDTDETAHAAEFGGVAIARRSGQEGTSR
jgi:hypothetical protein